MKPTLYLETTIPSYYTARPVRDVIVLAHQEITRTWWEHRLPLFDVYVSPVVLEEARQGDPEPARRRLQVLASFPVLEATPAYDFQCQEAATDFLHFLFPLVLCTACIGRAGARKRRRLSMLISVDWVPSSLRP